jgi:hypothetical protein
MPLTDSKFTDSKVKEVVRRKIWIAATVIKTKAGGYYYHTTENFPFVLGCYRGTPALANYVRNQQGTKSKNDRRGGRGSDSMLQYCEVDRKKYCSDMPPSREMMQCMMRNQNKFSTQCRQALQNHRPSGR